MENNISEQLFQAVETLIDKKFEQVKFDETIACIVQGKVANEDNLYEVKYNDSIIYKAIAKDGDKYDVGDQVYINIPYGNYNKEEKIILGKYANNQEESLAYEDPFKHFVVDKTWQLDNVVIEEMIPVVLPEVSLPGYDFMGLQLGLTTIATSPWLVSVTLLRADETPILPDEVLELFGEPEKAISPYFISSEEIYGNVNGLLPIFKQKKLFNFPYSLQLSDIAYLKINIYKANDNDSIIVNDLQLSFGYDVNKYLDKPLHLYIEGNFNNNFIYLADGLITGGKEKPDIKVLLIDQKEKSIKTELASNQSIRWYQYKIGEQGDTWGGGYWKYLGDQYDQCLTLPAAAYTLDLDRPNSQIKAVLCEQTVTTFYDNKVYEQTIDQRRALPEDSMYDKEQILLLGETYYEWNEEEGNWKSIDDLEDSIYDYCLKKITTPSLGDLYIFHWTQEDSLYLGTSYYQYDGAVWRDVLNTDSSNLQKIAASDPFIFTNQKAAAANAEGIIRIVAPENKTYFLAYDNGSQANNKPIKLTVESTSGAWPFGDSDEPFKVVWKVINNGLIQGLSLSEDTKDTVDEIVIDTENIKDISQPCYCYLKDSYNISAAAGINNVIACVINDKYQAFIELSFGELSTQGTNYSFKIEPTGTNYLRNAENATQSFKAILTTSDGIELDASNYELEWDWEQSSSYYKMGFSEVVWEKNGEEFVQKKSETEALQKLLKPYIDLSEWETNDCQITLQKEFSNNQIPPTFSYSYDASDTEQKYPLQIEVTNSGDTYNIHILKATCKVNALYKNGDNSETRIVTLKALYPIKILSADYYPQQLRVEGHFILNGSSDNTLLTELSTSYAIGELGQEVNYYEDVAWSLLNQEEDIPYTIIITQDNEDKKYSLQSEKKTFTSTSYPSTIMATWDNNFYQQPLMLQMVKYDIGLTNEWAGGVVTINNTESTIMATAIGAGHKDTSTNLFTGVLMGEFSQDKKVLNGLYGFSKGENTFGIDATTGDAYFKGHIEALSGNIGGWNITESGLINAESSFLLYSIPQEIPLMSYNIFSSYDGYGMFAIGQAPTDLDHGYNFVISGQGELYCSLGYFRTLKGQYIHLPETTPNEPTGLQFGSKTVYISATGELYCR